MNIPASSLKTTVLRLGAAAAAAGLFLFFSGCSSFEHHQYVFWGDIVPQHPETLEDHWSDYGPFLPDDRSMKMRRGKAGVLRFYKKGDYERSIPVDGELVVYVFDSSNGDVEGVELTKPKYKLAVSAQQLNRQRKFDKKTGYSYHIWLDLGEVDQPPENISILAVFTETKTRDQVASGVTYTQIGGEATREVEPQSDLEKSLVIASNDPDRIEKMNAEADEDGTSSAAGKTETEPGSNQVFSVDLSKSQTERIAAAPAPEQALAENEHRPPLKTAYVPAEPQSEPLNETRPIGSPKVTFDQLRSVGSPTYGAKGYLSQGVIGEDGTAQPAGIAEPNLLDPQQAGGAKGPNQ